jgi:hypothetical protein
MRLSLSLLAAASLIAITQVAFAAEQKGQGCDLRGVKGSGCEPGAKNVQPARQRGAAPTGHAPGTGPDPVGQHAGTQPNNPTGDKVNQK